jgi:hypothetical protein
MQNSNNLVNVMDQKYESIKKATKDLRPIENISSDTVTSPVTIPVTDLPLFVGRKNEETGYYTEVLNPKYIE